MAKKIKLSRKQIKQPDAIISWSEKAWVWMEDNYLAAAGILVGVIVLVFLIKGGLAWYQLGSDTPRIGLSQAEQTMSAPVSKADLQNDPMSFINNRDKNSFTSEEDKYNAAAKSFQDIADNNPGTPEGQLALLYLGSINEKLDNSDQAIDYYNKFLKTDYAQQAPGLGDSAKLGKARSLYEKKEYSQAMDLCNQIVGADSPVREEALILLARTQFRSGQKDQAEQTLEQARKDFPDSVLVLPADYLIAYWEANGPETQLTMPEGKASTETPETGLSMPPMEESSPDMGNPMSAPPMDTPEPENTP